MNPHPQLMLEYATALVRQAAASFRRRSLPLGITVIVHDASLTQTALHTTLATRAESRMALLAALSGSLMADGVTDENLPEVLEREADEFTARQEKNEGGEAK